MIFKQLESHIDNVPVGTVFVEIGSDRYEGSTAELDRLAGHYQSRLISVDISPDPSNRLGRQLANTEFVVANGRHWAQNYQGPPIACLYLDNFDYIWNPNQKHDPHVAKQISDYASRGMDMNNQNCQVEHMAQMIHLYPHMSAQAVIMVDDTPLYNDCWIGKCGPVVVYLKALGWNIVEQTTDTGVILKRT